MELDNLYHWSPTRVRGAIRRRGLKPTTETSLCARPVVGVGHMEVDNEIETVLAVCLGTSPATAWALSGYFSAEVGESWDLWEIRLTDNDEIYVWPTKGANIDEIRVINRIPRSQLWYVGTRIRADRRRWHAG